VPVHTLQPRLHARSNAEDPFLIGREIIWQGCDWPNEILVCISVKPAKTMWNFRPFSLSFYSSFDLGPKGGKSRLRKNITHGTCRYQPNRAQSLVSCWPRSGGVL